MYKHLIYKIYKNFLKTLCINQSNSKIFLKNDYRWGLKQYINVNKYRRT